MSEHSETHIVLNSSTRRANTGQECVCTTVKLVYIGCWKPASSLWDHAMMDVTSAVRVHWAFCGGWKSIVCSRAGATRLGGFSHGQKTSGVMLALYGMHVLFQSIYRAQQIVCIIIVLRVSRGESGNHKLCIALTNEIESSLQATKTTYCGLQEHRIIEYTATRQKQSIVGA
jgi:hypothetical protein